MKKTLLYLVAIGSLLSLGAHAQVTIGSAGKPVAGALLDLKDNGSYSNGETAVKGLGLPRVELKTTTPATPTELSASIGGTGNWDMDAQSA